MNFLKKKLKPLTSGSTSNFQSNKKAEKDLEDDLYDEYVVEAPPHPSELLALGVDPNEIDINDPEKLKQLYRKAKEEGKDKKTNSVLLAKQREKEEIEEKKKTREEWKFFDSITARVEQAVKDSQKTLQQLKESSAIEKLTEPDYELRLSADQVFKSSATVKQEKQGANNWIDFGEGDTNNSKEKEKNSSEAIDKSNLKNNSELVDEFGCPRKSSIDEKQLSQSNIVEELINDFGLDLRTTEQKKIPNEQIKPKIVQTKKETEPIKLDIDLKQAARPRPKPGAVQPNTKEEVKKEEAQADPFDTSFVVNTTPDVIEHSLTDEEKNITTTDQVQEISPRAVDPFDTSFINL